MTNQENLEKEIKKLDRKLEHLIDECLENDLSEERIYKLIDQNVYRKVAMEMNKINRTKNVISFVKILFITLTLSYLLTRRPLTTDLLKLVGRKMLINVSIMNVLHLIFLKI